MSIFKIRRKSDGLFRLSGSRGYNKKGKAHTQINFARSALECATPRSWYHKPQDVQAFLDDHEIVEFEIVEKAVHPAKKQ